MEERLQTGQQEEQRGEQEAFPHRSVFVPHEAQQQTDNKNNQTVNFKQQQHKNKCRQFSVVVSDLSDSPEHLRHGEHEGVVQEETQRPTQEVQAEAPPQSSQQEEAVAPLLLGLLQQPGFFCYRTTGPGAGPGAGPGCDRTSRLLPAEHQNKQTGMVHLLGAGLVFTCKDVSRH